MSADDDRLRRACQLHDQVVRDAATYRAAATARGLTRQERTALRAMARKREGQAERLAEVIRRARTEEPGP